MFNANYNDPRQLKPAACRLVTQMGVCVRPPIGVYTLASGVLPGKLPGGKSLGSGEGIPRAALP